jgi:hypothetical protein
MQARAWVPHAVDTSEDWGAGAQLPPLGTDAGIVIAAADALSAEHVERMLTSLHAPGASDTSEQWFEAEHEVPAIISP